MRIIKKMLIIIAFICVISVLLPNCRAMAQHDWNSQEGLRPQEKGKAQAEVKPSEEWKAQQEQKRLEEWKQRNNWRGEKYPYGGYYPGPQEGRYGQRKSIRTEGEARRMLLNYFSPQKATIGEIREKGWFFEAEIRDRHNNPIDRVIIDKRTGRIRSIY